MARPQTKKDLILAAQENFDKLMKLIESMSDNELNTEFDFSADAKKLCLKLKSSQMRSCFKKMFTTG